MSEDWTSLPQADMVTRFETDPRPAWLWPGDGKVLVWSNAAAKLFGAKLKPSGPQFAEPAVPVRGQISRIQRMGLLGRPIPSRVQFMAGRKPLSATCQCTMLDLGDEKPHLLMVAIEPIAPEIMAAAEPPPQQADENVPAAVDETETDARVQQQSDGLSALVDRLAEHEPLFDPLDEDEDAPFSRVQPADVLPGRDYVALAGDVDHHEQDESHSDWDESEALESEAAAFAADTRTDQGTPRAGLWQIAGRRLTASRALPDEPENENTDAQESHPDREVDTARPSPAPGEAVTRYNFEELSRILTDRVGRAEPDEEVASARPSRPSGSLVSLSEEGLVLNRLPIGILIFRDQDVVFANRAMVDLTGHDSASTLRSLGVSAILPTVDADEPAGPVTHLVHRDGEKVAVNARLHTVTWQGLTSFMLTARSDEVETLREIEVRRFAALWAKTAGYDFVVADTSGLIIEYESAASGDDTPAQGAPLTALLAASEYRALRNFLTLPARYAGDVRPAIALKSARPGQTLTLFAEGRAGIVTGYFGLLGGKGATAARPANTLPAETLSRITRGLRRPLNTISGFSELMTSEAFGPLPNARYREYARDIRAAGSEIGNLADELDDFARIAEGEMALSPADVDIATLLAECLVRVRGQAGKARVLLRSAISERLPLVRVDASTLKQAVLNMLASAISEASEGARVVLSGHAEDDGSVAVHVRDAAKGPNALNDRFVVFRDGLGSDGVERLSSPSSIGLALTRSLVAVNACSFSLAPSSESGTLMTLTIPASLVVKS